jgi:hypothetical protein
VRARAGPCVACTPATDAAFDAAAGWRAQIDPGSLTFCTGVSYVSCLRLPVPATYDKLVADVSAQAHARAARCMHAIDACVLAGQARGAP